MNEIINISELIPDDKNVNKGTRRGKEMIRKSIDKLGAGRSILIDKDKRIIAGNKTAENAAESGIKNVVIVHVTGNQLVAVMRDDVEIDSQTGRELAIADNRAGEVNLDFDFDLVASLDIDLSNFWNSDELNNMFSLPNYPGDDIANSNTPDSIPMSALRMVRFFFNDAEHSEYLQLIRAAQTRFNSSNLSDALLAVLRYANNPS